MAVREFCSKEEVRLPTGLRCNSLTCKGRVRRMTALTGIRPHIILGRYAMVACNTCGKKGLVEA